MVNWEVKLPKRLRKNAQKFRRINKFSRLLVETPTIAVLIDGRGPNKLVVRFFENW